MSSSVQIRSAVSPDLEGIAASTPYNASATRSTRPRAPTALPREFPIAIGVPVCVWTETDASTGRLAEHNGPRCRRKRLAEFGPWHLLYETINCLLDTSPRRLSGGFRRRFPYFRSLLLDGK